MSFCFFLLYTLTFFNRDFQRLNDNIFEICTCVIYLFEIAFFVGLFLIIFKYIFSFYFLASNIFSVKSSLVPAVIQSVKSGNR